MLQLVQEKEREPIAKSSSQKRSLNAYALDSNISVTGLDLVRTVGYELKAPLMHISHAASMLSGGDFTEEQRHEQYVHMEQSSRRMIRLVDSILFAGQIATDQRVLQLEPTNVSSVAHAVISELRPAARQHGGDVALKVSQQIVPAAVDKQALSHSLYALLDMSLRAQGGGTIELSIRRQTDCVLVTLKDSGAPFTTTQLKELFSRLGKAAQPIKQLPNTSGMSIYVALSLARAMQGDLLIKQSGGVRAFSLKLPLSQQLELV